MNGRWAALGLRGRLAASFAAIVVGAFAVVFIAVRAEMSHESGVIHHEESREERSSSGVEPGEGSRISPISDAQSDVEKTFLLVGAVSLVAALLAGYLLAARTASPLREFAATAAEVDAGDLTPRLRPDAGAATELRVLADAFNHMLDRLDQAFARQRQFVSDASHELRSPLTAMRGQLEVLARKDQPGVEEIRRVEAMTRTEMQRVERLVDDLLTLAHLDEGVRPSLEEVRVPELLRGLSVADSERATEIGELAEGTVRVDPHLIAQVVRNLLSNADRHAGPGGRVVLSARADGPNLIVSVDDDGPGVPPAQRERVFDRFHRSEASRDRGSGGSGLGLGIARSIVEAHEGRIWVDESHLGGARVSFELPGFAPASPA